MEFDFNECVRQGVEQAMNECELIIGMSLREAVRRQIPKKIEETEAYPHRLFCPTCAFTLAFNKLNADYIKSNQKYNFCPACGQALDWEEA